MPTKAIRRNRFGMMDWPVFGDRKMTRALVGETVESSMGKCCVHRGIKNSVNLRPDCRLTHTGNLMFVVPYILVTYV
jgi:hypothetical protein